MRIITVREGQTLQDIAIQEYGDVDAVPILLYDNPEMNLTLDSQLQAGQQLQIVSAPVDAGTVAFFRSRNYRVNTGASTSGTVPQLPPVENGFEYVFPIIFSS